MNIPHLRLDVFGVDLYLTTTRAEWKALRQSQPHFDQLGKRPKSTGRAQLVPASKRNGAAVVLYVNLDDDSNAGAELYDTAAHEARHAADFVLEVIGQSPWSADEVAAYLTGYIAKWIIETALEARAPLPLSEGERVVVDDDGPGIAFPVDVRKAMLDHATAPSVFDSRTFWSDDRYQNYCEHGVICGTGCDTCKALELARADFDRKLAAALAARRTHPAFTRAVRVTNVQQGPAADQVRQFVVRDADAQ